MYGDWGLYSNDLGLLEVPAVKVVLPLEASDAAFTENAYQECPL